MNKNDRKYLKTALRMLRQGNSMLLKISENTDIDDVSRVTSNMNKNIDDALKLSDLLKDYLTGQLSLKFEE